MASDSIVLFNAIWSAILVSFFKLNVLHPQLLLFLCSLAPLLRLLSVSTATFFLHYHYFLLPSFLTLVQRDNKHHFPASYCCFCDWPPVLTDKETFFKNGYIAK